MFENRPNVVIIDYGMGNLFSLKRVINHLGGTAVISGDPDGIVSAERLILPGVGAFGDGMENLSRRDLVGPIREFVRAGKPLLGICLGMQLLMDESEEFGINKGLEIVPGRVEKIPDPSGAFYKIPHVGWNKLYASTGEGRSCWKGTILDGIPEGAFVYFVHSYMVRPESPFTVLAETEYGNNRFCSVLRQDNLFGCQFHPEVSGETGLNILKKFLYGF